MDEIAALTPEFAGVSFERLGARGLQWPVAPDGTDSEILYGERFAQPGGRGRFAALPFKPPGDAADEEFPLILVTGRDPRALQRRHDDAADRETRSWSTATGWRSTPTTPPGCGSATASWCRFAAAWDGSSSTAASPTASSRATCSPASTSPRRRTNLLVGSSADVNTSCPEYKVVAVDVRPMPERSAATPALAEA